MIEGIRDYAQWLKLAREAGFEGPYTLVGNPPGEQFVYRQGGSAALWNSDRRIGVVFDPK